MYVVGHCCFLYIYIFIYTPILTHVQYIYNSYMFIYICFVFLPLTSSLFGIVLQIPCMCTRTWPKADSDSKYRIFHDTFKRHICCLYHPFYHSVSPSELFTCPVISRLAFSEIKGNESCLWLDICQDYMGRLTSCCPTYA